MKKLISVFIVLCLLMSFTASAFAQTYDLGAGDISIYTDHSGQYVTQENGVTNELQTSETVITDYSDTPTSNTITIDAYHEWGADDNPVVEVTLKDLDIQVDSMTSAIDIKTMSDVVLNIEGTNNITAVRPEDDFSTHASVINVAYAGLTITGEGSSASDNVLNVSNLDEKGDGAAIGTNRGRSISANITIDGYVTVNAETAGEGAAIGSGADGDAYEEMEITIGGNAVVNASSGSGAGLGCAEGGSFNGKVTIKDNAVVTAESKDHAAAIGGGGSDTEFYGHIVISDNAVVTAKAVDGAGIGGGRHDDFKGSVTISDNAVVTAESSNASGIGAGRNSAFTKEGYVDIGDNATVTASTTGNGTAIGAYDNYKFDGYIYLHDSAVLYLYDVNHAENGDPLLGFSAGNLGKGTVEIGPDVKINVLPLENEDDKDDEPDSEEPETEEPEVDMFWAYVLRQIKAAEKGAEIRVNPGDREYVPVSVLDAAAQQGVTLIIEYNGQDIVVNKAFENKDNSVVVSLSALVEFYK